MSYSTFYCNEQLLLDNWEYYKESNQLLRNTLRKTNLSSIECATIYYEHMRNPESVSYDRSSLLCLFPNKRKNRNTLLQINSVVLYKKDIEYVRNARKKFHISYKQMLVLFGIIFFCRMMNRDHVSLETEFKMRRFSKCFKEQTAIKYYQGESWDSGYNTVHGLYELSDKYKVLERRQTEGIGCVYFYPEFKISNNDSVEYIFTVTKENNKLDLTSIVNSIFDRTECYCIVCGDIYRSIKPNASLYCSKCAAMKEKIRIRNYKLNKKKEKQERNEITFTSH